MDEKMAGAWGLPLGCLATAGAYLLLDFILRYSPLTGHVGYLQIILPPVLGFGMGRLTGRRWRHPILASLLLAAALIVAHTIPYTIDTMAMANESDESYASIAREHPSAAFAGRSPSELRALAIKGRVISFPFAVLFIGGLTTLGALAGRRLGRG